MFLQQEFINNTFTSCQLIEKNSKARAQEKCFSYLIRAINNVQYSTINNIIPHGEQFAILYTLLQIGKRKHTLTSTLCVY